MDVIAGVTLGIALLGAVLGVINTWRSIDASRVKLKVVPKHAFFTGLQPVGPPLEFAITVTNLSAFPVTINEVGVCYRGTKKRGVFISPYLADGGSWPRRLEPRSSVSAYTARPESLPGHSIKCVYAETDCGVCARGTSPAFKQIARG